VHGRKFVSRYIASILKESDFRILANLSGLDDLKNIPPDANPALCIIGSGAAPLSEVCATLRTQFPASHLVLIDAEGFEETRSLAKSLGLDGCLSLDLAPQLLLAGLRLVIAGTQCFPKTDKATRRNGALRGARASERQNATLTPREKAVLSLIGEGMANKVIARELSISESTVKAHLNAVLRKTGTTNRTQAARWAFENSVIV